MTTEQPPQSTPQPAPPPARPPAQGASHGAAGGGHPGGKHPGGMPGRPAGATDPGDATHSEEELLSGARQLVFEGARSGEGYFDPACTRMVFQAEREPGNPFYQIYLLDLTTGDARRLSPGYGKTTCAWIHPGGRKVLFSSTHADPRAREKMAAELAQRAQGEQRRQTFDYDEHYDIYEMELEGNEYRNLTRSHGYDAESSWSPDGSRIAFASNRRAYAEALTTVEAELFARDPANLCDIYVMDADGGNVRRLTDHLGYDGGPFFSPDGRRIVWRRFDAEGTVAEIWTMAVDGSDQRQLTRMGAMCWAPFYHPSGDYVIFTTNRHGFQNFELYMVDVAGEREPVRVTFTDGPDVLPVFTPNGERLTWVTRRGFEGQPHLFMAEWNDARARELLGLAPAHGRPHRRAAVAEPLVPRADYARRHVERLTAEDMAGRRAGSAGEALAAGYVAEQFAALGLVPAGSDGFLQPFPFTSDVSMAAGNELVLADSDGSESSLAVDADWRPLAFSRVGACDAADVVFAGYGLVAPAAPDQPGYDAYGDLDVRGRWVLVLRYLPEDVSPERRQHLNRFAALRFKAAEARDRGAVGLIVASGPHSQAREQLVPLRFDGTVAGASIAAVSVSDAVAAGLLASAGRDLAQVQAALDGGEALPGFGLAGRRVSSRVALALERSTGRNVLGRLQLAGTPSPELVVIGAHLDHLGHGEGGSSLARGGEEGVMHPGADDNASGVAGVIEIARYLRALAAAGALATARRDVLFAAWSGEELGLLGSGHFVKACQDAGGDSLHPAVAANLNLDMIGRLERSLMLQGVGSSSVWRREVERANVLVGLPVSLSNETYLPSDATSFYLKGVPFLSAFTGAHTEHHSPRDTADRLDFAGLARIAHLMGRIAVSLMTAPEAPPYVKMPAPAPRSGGGRRAYLGTIPDFGESAAPGVLLGGVATGSPAESAGLRAGDLVVEAAGQAVENLYDYQRVLEGMKIGQETELAVVRGGRRLTLRIVPGSRD